MTGSVIAIPLPGHAQSACVELYPVYQEIDLYSKSADARPTKRIHSYQFGNSVCRLGEENGRYLLHTAKGDFWVPSWQLMTTGRSQELQPLPRPPKPIAAPVALSQPKETPPLSIADELNRQELAMLINRSSPIRPGV
jgi:hypothetical protein